MNSMRLIVAPQKWSAYRSYADFSVCNAPPLVLQLTNSRCNDASTAGALNLLKAEPLAAKGHPV